MIITTTDANGDTFTAYMTVQSVDGPQPTAELINHTVRGAIYEKLRNTQLIARMDSSERGRVDAAS